MTLSLSPHDIPNPTIPSHVAVELLGWLVGWLPSRLELTMDGRIESNRLTAAINWFVAGSSDRFADGIIMNSTRCPRKFTYILIRTIFHQTMTRDESIQVVNRDEAIGQRPSTDRITKEKACFTHSIIILGHGWRCRHHTVLPHPHIHLHLAQRQQTVDVVVLLAPTTATVAAQFAYLRVQSGNWVGSTFGQTFIHSDICSEEPKSKTHPRNGICSQFEWERSNIGNWFSFLFPHFTIMQIGLY